jgi:hypothetical protein
MPHGKGTPFGGSPEDTKVLTRINADLRCFFISHRGHREHRVAVIFVFLAEAMLPLRGALANHHRTPSVCFTKKLTSRTGKGFPPFYKADCLLLGKRERPGGKSRPPRRFARLRRVNFAARGFAGWIKATSGEENGRLTVISTIQMLN